MFFAAGSWEKDTKNGEAVMSLRSFLYVTTLEDSELFILFAENSQILPKISIIPILLTFICVVALYLLQQ